MQVVILCGGLAERLFPRTRNIAKSMLLIEGKPFLSYQLTLLKNAGITDVVLCTCHLGDQIEQYFEDGSKFGVNIRYSYETQLTGTAGALKFAEDLLDESFLVMYGDSYLNIDYNKFTLFSSLVCLHSLGEIQAVMAVYKNENKFDTSNVEFIDDYHILYDKHGKEECEYIDYGLSYLSKRVLDIIPDSHFCSLSAVFKTLSITNKLIGYKVMDRFYEIGSFTGLNEFREVVKEEPELLICSQCGTVLGYEDDEWEIEDDNK